MISLYPESRYPVFIQRNGQWLTRKIYDLVIKDGKVETVNLPLPGFQPEYLNDQQLREWNAKNKKILESAGRK